jgi:23S rRNA pseudouridine1911/1915/1917 synthase
MTHSIVVPNLEQPMRLDKFLVQELGAGWSRTAIQHAIEQGGVKVNGKKVAVHHFLKQGEEITVDPMAQPPKQLAAVPNASVQFTVIEESPDFIVIEKPAGLTVHPAPGVNDPTLAAGLLARFPELSGVGEDKLRPGIVHRLDREVSGLMIVARTQTMYEHLKQQFMDRTIDKTYAALVIGHMVNPSGTITFPLARSKRNHGKVAARAASDEDTREAVTHYVVEKQYQQVALLSVTIETGRTHQIRAHLAAIDHPIVGDQLYRPKSLSFKAAPGRIFLHAVSLAFTDLSGERRSFSSPLPPELQDFLKRLS